MNKINIKMLGFFVVLIYMIPDMANAHGRLIEPPSRASMWRYGFDTPPNYNDNQLFCGGFYKQHGVNDGRCGVCGDDYSAAEPRAHEGGGYYATGIIARTYSQGQVIDVTIEITASHLGWFEFRLCAHNDPSTPITHECLDEHLLYLEDDTTRVSGIENSRQYYYRIRLPEDVTCSQCVLQWKYHTGNNWGTDPDGSQGLGKGDQEEFYGCADVAIESSLSDTTKPSTSSSESTSSLLSTILSSSTTHPTTTFTLASAASTSSTTTVSSSTSSSSVSSASTPGGEEVCRAAGAYIDVDGMDDWCEMNCSAGYCPPSHCACSAEN